MRNVLLFISAISAVSVLAGEPQGLSIPDSTLMKTRVKLVRKMEANAQGQANIVVKMNLTQLMMKTLAFQGEYAFHKNLSFAFGVHFVLPKKAPSLLASEDPTGEGLRGTKFSGWAVTPEVRFYPGAKEKHQAPHGFYLAPYFRYGMYTLKSSFHDEYNDGTTKQEFGYDLKFTYKGYTAGLMLGAQWLLSEHFSLDWWIFGAGGGKANANMNVVGTGFTLDEQEQAELKRELELLFNTTRVLGVTPEVETTENSATVKISGLPMFSYRGFGICLGYAF